MTIAELDEMVSQVTQVFSLRAGEWLLMLDGKIAPSVFASKAAALAAVPAERARRAQGGDMGSKIAAANG
jgi:hypothetical protein